MNNKSTSSKQNKVVIQDNLVKPERTVLQLSKLSKLGNLLKLSSLSKLSMLKSLFSLKIILLNIFILPTQGIAKDLDAVDLLKSSDRSRGAAASTQGLSWIADISSVENDDSSEVQYKVRALGDDALAEVVKPVRQKGEIILFNDRTLWFFKPGLKKPVSLSARQKLSGQAANGDIASIQYARDYDAKLIGEDTVLAQNCWKLELKAKSKNTTYDKITYWISKKDKLAVRADFLTIAGEVFKTAEFKYGNTITVKAGSFPFISEMKILDAFNSKNMTLIKYQAPHEETHAKMIFNVNNIIR